MTISLLEQYLSARRPVIVLIQAWKDDDDTTPYPINFENGHYVVAIGFDNQNIYFEDPWIHGSITYMRKIDLIDRWHGNTDEPVDRHIYGSGIIVM
jgi:predicted double-glycine peptidase